jgi:hypothetical protein
MYSLLSFVSGATIHFAFVSFVQDEEWAEGGERPHLVGHPDGEGIGYCRTLVRLNVE